MYEIKQRMTELLKSMSHGAYEREEVIALALLAAMSGESIFLLGLPGVGKSMVARRLKMAFKESKSFEYLMSRFSTPDEIFGPVSITKLKDNDTYERVIDGYLPTADIIFLDEIWKAGPAIQNSLLTVLNERLFRNGDHDIKLPLKTIISASNELPAEGEGLEALWDRFLVRYVVTPISGRGAFLKLLKEKGEECSIDEELQFTDEEFKTMQKQSGEITVPELVCNIICDIHDILSDERKALQAMPAVSEPPYVSDRRWRKIIGILRTSAMLNGRSQIDPSDCLLLENLLWDKDEQILPIKKLVADVMVKRMGKDLPRSITAEDMELMTFTEPIGELLCPDGKNYVFSAGGEDVYISKSDYESLSDQLTYGEMTADNHLILTKSHGAFTVRKKNYGHIILNSFTYMMKRDSPLRTGNADTMLKAVNANAEKLNAGLNFMIEENLFLRSSDGYPELKKAFETTKFTVSNLKGK
jgi:MoxR-like ATPase